MCRRAEICIICFMVTVALVAGCGKKPPAPSPELEFTAIMEMKYPDATVENRINFTRYKQRVEAVMAGGSVTIVRLDRECVWYMMPAFRRYLQMPMKPEYKNPLMYQPDVIEKYEEVGNETVDGHPTVKEKMVIKNKGSDNPITLYRWFATDIRWPIKAEDEKGGWTLSFRDIQTGRQDPSLFELPAGFVRMGNRMPDNR